jgi:hypothetical protein
LSSASGGRSLEVDDQFRQKIHPLNKLVDIAGSTVLDSQIVADQIFAVVSGQLDQIVTQK